MKKACLFIAILLLFSNLISNAAPKILVTDSPIVMEDLSINTEIIDLSDDNQPGRTVAQVLNNQAGLKVKHYGGIGEFSSLFMRGMAPSHITIFIDGIPITGGYSEVVNLSEIPVGMVDRVEIYKGFTPYSFLNSQLGGAINIVTKSPTNSELSVETALKAGSFGYQGVGLAANKGFEIFSVNATLDYSTQDGDYPFSTNNETIYNSNDDYTTVRQNNQTEVIDLILGATFNYKIYQLKLKNEIYDKKSGIAGLGYNQASNASYFSRRNLFSISARSLKPDNNIEAALFLTNENKRFKDILGEVGFGQKERQTVIDKLGTTVSYSSYSLLKPFYTKGQISYSIEDLEESELFQVNQDLPSTSRDRYSLALMLERDIGNFKIIPTFRHELVKNHSSLLNRDYRFSNYKIGGLYSKTDNLGFHANIGLQNKVPTFTELFGEPLAIRSSVELEPERSLNKDIGLQFNKSFANNYNLTLKTALFDIDSKDLIVYIYNSQRSSKAINVSRARIQGLEFSSRISTPMGLSFNANYTYQRGINKSRIVYYHNNWLPNIPEHQLTFQTLFRSNGFEIYYDIDYIDNLWLDGVNYDRIDSKRIDSLGINKFFEQEHIRVGLKIENLTDDDSNESPGYPVAGRSWYLTATFKN
ncbi:MAG: TonB-dependent receptor [Nitrospinota bacterium]